MSKFFMSAVVALAAGALGLNGATASDEAKADACCCGEVCNCEECGCCKSCDEGECSNCQDDGTCDGCDCCSN